MLAAIATLFVLTFALPVSAQEKEAYVVKSTDGKALTFYYDANRTTRTGTIYGINERREDYPDIPIWAGGKTEEKHNNTTEKVVFDSTFKDYTPTLTAYWFYYCTALKSIENMENLNTIFVYDMGYMFNGCHSLTSLDLRNFKTKYVKLMCSMFCDCSSLTSLDLSSFDTKEVIWMRVMFSGCTSLTSVNLSSFDTSNVHLMERMFYNCRSLTSVNLENFNTERVTNMNAMFRNCTSLTTIDLTNFKTSILRERGAECMFDSCTSLTTIYCNNKLNCKQGNYTFLNCKNLKGGTGITYNETKIDVTMANPTTGYFTLKPTASITTIVADDLAPIQPIYNLNGMRMKHTWNALPNGIYIIGEKKMVKR